MDDAKRKFLKQTAIAMTVAGGAVVTIPFISSMRPVQTEQEYLDEHNALVDISDIPPGGMKEVPWTNEWHLIGFIAIVRRTEQELSYLDQLLPDLKDPYSKESEQPPYVQNAYRSLRKDIFVGVNRCTHLGCKLLFKPHLEKHDWPDYARLAGFDCPCHGSYFDLAGRVYKGMPAKENLSIPPYHFVAENLIRIGVHPPATQASTEPKA